MHGCSIKRYLRGVSVRKLESRLSYTYTPFNKKSSKLLLCIALLQFNATKIIRLLTQVVFKLRNRRDADVNAVYFDETRHKFDYGIDIKLRVIKQHFTTAFSYFYGAFVMDHVI